MADMLIGNTGEYTPPQEKYKDNFVDDLKASAVLTINGAFNMMDGKYNIPVNDIESNFSHLNPEVQKLYKDYGVTPEDQTDFYDSRGMQHLLPRLERYKARREAAERLNENQPLMQYPLMMGTSLADLPSLALAPLGYKVASSINAIRNAGRIGNAVKVASGATLANVGSEYLLQASADSIDGGELATVATFSALFGGGLGALIPANRAISTQNLIDDMTKTPTEADIVRRQEDIFGINDFNHIKEGFQGKIEGLKAKFVWSPIGQMMKSDNPVTRALGNVLEKSPLALTNGDEIVTSASKTAMDTKGTLQGYYFNFLRTMEQNFKAFKKDNPSLTRAQYHQQMGDRYRSWLRDVEEEAMLKYDEVATNVEAKSAIYKQVTGKEDVDLENLDAVVIDSFKKEIGASKELSNDLKPLQAYYDKIQQFGEEVGHSALKGRSGKTYMNRVFNKEAIEAMGTARASEILVEAMRANPITRRQIQNMLSEGMTRNEIDTAMKEYAEGVISKIKRASVYEEMDFKNVNEINTPTPLKGRMLQIDETIAGELLERDILKLTEYYNYKTSGKLALKKHLGIERTQDIEKYTEEIRKQGEALGHSNKQIAKDLDMFKAVIDSVNGTREIAQRPNTWGQKSARLFTKFNYVTLGGTFGLNTLGEVGSVIASNGIKAMKYFVPSVKETIKMYRGNPTRETTNELLALGLGEQIYRANRTMRYDSLDTFNTDGKVESLLDKGSNLMSNASGLNFMTTALELTAGASTIEDLMRMATKSSLSRAEQKRLARLGLTKEDIQGIQTHSKAVYEDGYLMAYNFDDWTDQALVDKIKDSIREVVKNSILQADPTTIPVWATNPDNPLLKIATQFMRFPMVAHERLFLKGLDEMSVRQTTGFMATAGLMAAVYSLREEAMIQAGIISEADRKYDWDTEEGLMNLGIATANKVGALGITPTAFDYMNKLFNADSDTYGTDSTTMFMGTLNRVNQASDLIKNIQDGDVSKRELDTIKYFMPGYTLPPVKFGIDVLTKE